MGGKSLTFEEEDEEEDEELFLAIGSLMPELWLSHRFSAPFFPVDERSFLKAISFR